jgi:hypothetical protein
MNYTIRSVVLAVLFTFAVGAGNAFADGTKWSDDGNAAYAGLRLGTFGFANDPVDARLADLRAGGGLVPVYPDAHFPLNIGAEFGLFFLKGLSLGVLVEHHRRHYMSPSTNFVFSGWDITTFSAHTTEGLLDLRAWYPTTLGGMFGVAYGASRATFKQDTAGRFEWSDTAPVAMFYTGVQFHPGEGNGLMVTSRVGYAMRDYGTLDDDLGQGDSVDLDLSGWFVDVGFGAVAGIRGDK